MNIESCRIGEAGNPGPGINNKQTYQKKLGYFFNTMHIIKDDKAEWCKEQGYTIEGIKGDGNCLYICLRIIRNLSGNIVRQSIVDKTTSTGNKRWNSILMEVDLSISKKEHNTEHNEEVTSRR
eukprot:1903252-Heterocapsa_arctica.AAC.1